MSIAKFFNEQGAEHGAFLQWPGLYGLPLRGDAGLLKDEELDEFYETARDFHCKEFDLSDPEQFAEYTQVMDRIVNGWYIKIHIDRYRDEATKKMIVYLEWCHQYSQINPKAQTRLTPTANYTERKMGSN